MYWLSLLCKPASNHEYYKLELPGSGKPRAVRALGDLVKSHKPNVLFLIETLSGKDRISKLVSKLGFVDFFSVDSSGRSRGLAILWDRNVKCQVMGFDNNHIDVVMLKGGDLEWRVTGFYGFSERARRKDSWEFLKLLSVRDSLPWVVLGDLNDMLKVMTKRVCTGIRKAF